LQSKANFWQAIIDKYDGYKDAYFQKALLEYNLGQIDKAKEDNAKALLLDPNFTDAKKLETVLNNK
jgi:tetratricopeptide (TPR) repeat protein